MNTKQIVLSIALLAISIVGFAQVGVGTSTPQGALDVVSTNSGIILPRVANTAAVTSPINGMLVFDMSSSCFKGYQNGAWTDCGLVPAVNTPPVSDVTSSTGKIWMDRNLGASQVATSSTDAASYGDLYQWGRLTDGHELRTSSTTTTLSSGDAPGNASFIITSSSPYDWRLGQNNNLWQGVSGTNNPCPAGYRLPTSTELNAERLAFPTDNAAGAFASVLKLPAAGRRRYTNGALIDVGTEGFYWSSTASSNNTIFLFFGSGSTNLTFNLRAFGQSVRCIKD